MAAHYNWQGDTLKLNVKVITGSKHQCNPCVELGRLKLHLKARPVDNHANRELIEYLAQCFSVPKSSVSLLRGQKSSLKTLLIQRPKQLYGGVKLTG